MARMIDVCLTVPFGVTMVMASIPSSVSLKPPNVQETDATPRRVVAPESGEIIPTPESADTRNDTLGTGNPFASGNCT